MDTSEVREIILRVNGEDAQRKIDSLRRLDAARGISQYFLCHLIIYQYFCDIIH